jgi:hypothetical protein
VNLFPVTLFDLLVSHSSVHGSITNRHDEQNTSGGMYRIVRRIKGKLCDTAAKKEKNVSKTQATKQRKEQIMLGIQKFSCNAVSGITKDYEKEFLTCACPDGGRVSFNSCSQFLYLCILGASDMLRLDPLVRATVRARAERANMMLLQRRVARNVPMRSSLSLPVVPLHTLLAFFHMILFLNDKKCRSCFLGRQIIS